jgi:hypothetical protein
MASTTLEACELLCFLFPLGLDIWGSIDSPGLVPVLNCSRTVLHGRDGAGDF